MTNLLRVTAALSTLFALAASANPVAGGVDVTFEFGGWSGPSVPVRLFVPDAVDADTPIVVVMHGASREAKRYYNDWRKEAGKLGFIMVVPYFSREDFPRSAHYNLGHIFEPETGKPRPAESWT